MADNVTFQSTVLATPPDGTIAATDEVGGRHYQLIKQAFGADGAATLVSASDPLPVTATLSEPVEVDGTVVITDGGGSITVDGTVAATLSEPISVDDNGGSLTVDGTVTIQDGGNTITVDNGGTFATQATLQTGDNTVGRVKITDGTDVADVFDLANSNPLTVAIVDGSGSQITSFGGSGGTAEVDDSAFTAATDSGTPIMGFVTADSVDSGDVGVLGMLANRQLKVTLFDSSGVELSVGGGTQYTEDAAAAANPVGNAIIVVRDDDRGGSLTSADGDNIALRGTDAGEVYVKHVDEISINDGGNVITVDGTVAATLSEPISVDDNGGSLTVDGTVAATQSGAWNIADISGTVSLPTGASTAAKQDTIIGHVDGIEGLLTTIDGDTGNIVTSVQLLDDTVFAEDVAAQAADKGIAILAVRRDADTSLVGTDNDYANLQVDANGALKVEIFDGGGSHTVDNNGTFATQATLQTGDNTIGRVKITDGTDVADVLDLTNSNPVVVAIVDGDGSQITSFGGGTQYTEDAAAAANPVGTALNLVRDDARGGSLTSADGDNVAARGTDAGELYVKHVDAIDIGDISGTVSLPTGAATAANQTTIIGHVDGIEGLLTTIDGDTGNIVTSVQLLDDTVFAEDVAAQAADKGIAILAVRRDADTSLVGTDNDYANLQVNATGALKVEIFDGGDSHTIDGTVTIQDGGNTITVDNGGTFAVQVDGSALTALQLIDNASIADDAAFTPATTGITMAGFFADESSTDSVDEGDGGAARMTLDRKQIVVPQPHTAGGLTIFRSIDLDESEEEVKATPGCVYSCWVTNTATSTRFLKFYNLTAANTTVGSSTPVITIGIPGNTSDDVSGVFTGGGVGIMFDTAITVAATTGVADADSGAPGANEVLVNIFYK